MPSGLRPRGQEHRRRVDVDHGVKILGTPAAAAAVIRAGCRLRIVPLPHLVALKLYAGGTKSRADIVELLSRHPDADLAAIRDLCRNWRLRGLDQLIEEAMGEP